MASLTSTLDKAEERKTDRKKRANEKERREREGDFFLSMLVKNVGGSSSERWEIISEEYSCSLGVQGFFLTDALCFLPANIAIMLFWVTHTRALSQQHESWVLRWIWAGFRSSLSPSVSLHYRLKSYGVSCQASAVGPALNIEFCYSKQKALPRLRMTQLDFLSTNQRMEIEGERSRFKGQTNKCPPMAK